MKSSLPKHLDIARQNFAGRKYENFIEVTNALYLTNNWDVGDQFSFVAIFNKILDGVPASKVITQADCRSAEANATN